MEKRTPVFPPSGIRLVAVDLDGTLMNSRKELPAGAAAIFAQARRAGVRLSITTGRNVCSVNTLAKILHLNGPHISSGGSMITGNGGRPVYTRHVLSFEETRQIVEICRRFNLIIYLHSGSRILVENRSSFVPQVQRPFYPCSPEPCQDILAALHFKPLKVTIFGAHVPSVLEEARAELAKCPTGFNMTTAGELDIEITPQGVNKGSALREMAAITGIPLQHVMVIGDSLNDLPMFGEAGLAVAVANAMPEVKQAADRIVPSNDEAGVLWAIQNMVLSPTLLL
ncbi:MAG TPA: HAD family hydrolase [Anaerolineales bacterium]|nr:HAD family hydrolase [Anaerolineales bacterium]